MNEKLAIKSDKTKFWKKEDSRAVVDLEPRPGEDSKSSWAHVLAEDCAFADFLEGGGGRANRRLQALAMMIFSEVNQAQRSKITGVSIHRPVLSAVTVLEEPDLHPVRGCDVTHRSIVISSDQARHQLVVDIFAQEAYDCWEYSREELVPLLQNLLDAGMITADFLGPALSLLKRSIGE
jgi:hypothetical protein